LTKKAERGMKHRRVTTIKINGSWKGPVVKKTKLWRYNLRRGGYLCRGPVKGQRIVAG